MDRPLGGVTQGVFEPYRAAAGLGSTPCDIEVAVAVEVADAHGLRCVEAVCDQVGGPAGAAAVVVLEPIVGVPGPGGGHEVDIEVFVEVDRQEAVRTVDGIPHRAAGRKAAGGAQVVAEPIDSIIGEIGVDQVEIRVPVQVRQLDLPHPGTAGHQVGAGPSRGISVVQDVNDPATAEAGHIGDAITVEVPGDHADSAVDS